VGLLARPLPYPDGDRLAVIWQVHQGQAGQISYPDFRDLTGGALFEAASAMSGGRGSLRVGDRIKRVNLLSLQPEGYLMLGAAPALGRLLRADDAGSNHVLVSDRLWRTHLGADPDVVGQGIWLSGTTYTIVGVLEPGFDFELPVGPFERERHDLWALFDAGQMAERRDVSGVEAIVRLPPGLAREAAQDEVDRIGERLARDHEATNRKRTFRVADLRGEIVAPVRRSLLAAGLGAVLTMGLAAANMLALAGIRLSERRSELAVRQALGAGAFRLRRQLMTEHLALVVSGVLAGVVAARAIVTTAVASEAANLPRADAIRFDASAYGVAASIAVILAALLSLLPLGAGGPADALRSGTRVAPATRRVRRALIAAELALALVLSTGAGLLGLSLSRVLAVDPGFDAAGVASVRVSAYAARHPGRGDVERFFDSVVDAVGALPGVSRAAAGSSLALSGQTTGTSVMAEGQPLAPGSQLGAGWQFVTPGYFEAHRMRIRSGRDFSRQDRERDGHVTVVNETLARALFPAGDAVGRRIAVSGGVDADGDWHEIVGVVDDVRHLALTSAAEPRVYDLFGEHWGRTLYVVTRVDAGDAASLIAPVRRAVATIDREAPVFEETTMAALVDRSAAPHRLAAAVAGALAVVALVLAVLGVHAVTSVFVAERTREVGIRAALGASRRDLWRFVLGDCAGTVALGLSAGAVLSWLLVRATQSAFFGVPPVEAAAIVPIVAACLAVATLVAVMPSAARAATADPLIAMRVD
jgi:predicted permease